MSKKKFNNEVLRLLPQLALSDQYFYFRSSEHILSGFLCETPPSGAYVWKFAFPLYDRSPFLHLGYGSRLEGSDQFIYARGEKEHEVASEFVRRIKPHIDEVSKLSALENFARYVKESVGLSNPLIRRGYACTLILLGQVEEASKELRFLRSLSKVQNDGQFQAGISELIESIEQGDEIAERLLLGWEAETRRILKIE